MAFASLRDVYFDQLRDIRNADEQAREMTEQLADAACDPELRKALHAGVAGIEDGRDVLDRIAEAHGLDPDHHFSKGMDGLAKEAESYAIDANYDDDDVRDAVIIGQYQRMVHYAVAGYGCMRAFAARLDFDDDARKLEALVEQTREGDRRMNEIAEGVNSHAA